MHTDHHLRFRTSRVLSSGHVSHVASLARLPLRRAPRPPTILRRVPRLATPRRAPRPPTVHTAATAPIIAATARTITVTAPTIAATAPTSARAISAGSCRHASSLRIRVLLAHFSVVTSCSRETNSRISYLHCTSLRFRVLLEHLRVVTSRSRATLAHPVCFATTWYDHTTGKQLTLSPGIDSTTFSRPDSVSAYNSNSHHRGDRYDHRGDRPTHRGDSYYQRSRY
jgi:hypothetical protein